VAVVYTICIPSTCYVLFLLVVSACSYGPIGKIDSIGWYKDYGIPTKDDLKDTRYIPNLINALKDENRRVAINAARALGRMGADAKSSLPVLSKVAVSDRHFSVRTYAVDALSLIGKESPVTINTFVNLMLNGRSEKILVYATKAFSTLGPSAEPAVSQLIEALKSGNAGVKKHVAKTLGNIGPRAKAALPTLEIVAQHDSSKSVRNFAQEAIRRITYTERTD